MRRFRHCGTGAPKPLGRAVVLAIVATALITCSPTDDASVLEELLTADRAFAAATAARGIDGWVAAFATDGAMYRPDQVIRGHAAIRDLMTPLFADPTTRLAWEPTEAFASRDGTLGYTTGRYRLTDGSTGRVVSRGTYLTVWRRTAQGWKVAADIGAEADP